MRDQVFAKHPIRRLLSNRRTALIGAAAAAAAALHATRPEVAQAAALSGDSAVSGIPAVYGENTAVDGRGIFGYAGATTGVTHGIEGTVQSTTNYAAGVSGLAQGGSGITYGVQGYTSSSTGNASGVKGEASSGATNGVWGENSSSSGNATGVFGVATSTTTTGNTIGVWGRSNSTAAGARGVLGQANCSGTAVRGEVQGASSNAGAGVVGVAAGCEFGNGANVGVGGSGRGANKTGVLGLTDGGIGVEGWGIGAGTGVRGLSNGGGGPDFGGSGIGVEGRSGSGIGVRGESTSGVGVYGQSANNFGCGGVAQKAGYSGLYGAAGVAGSAAFYAVAAVPGSYAGSFDGPVYINGSYTATGAKSAAVKKRDGTHVRLYCQESPEPWFEDFGTATLVNGQASVPLDPEFDEVVQGDDYRVFLTEIGDCGGLFVQRKGPHQFVVRSRAGAAASGSFDYRVVARRLDNVGKRLEKVDIPAMAPIEVDKLTRPSSQPGKAG